MKTLPGRTVWHGEGLGAVGLSGMLRGPESPLTGAPSANVRRTLIYPHITGRRDSGRLGRAWVVGEVGGGRSVHWVRLVLQEATLWGASLCPLLMSFVSSKGFAP